jgi:hypothetical protein
MSRLPIDPRLLLLVFHRDRDSPNRGEAYFVALDTGNEAAINEVVMPLVASLAAVFLGQLDPITLDLIDCTDVDTVRADYFHVFLDFSHSALRVT